jgi:hypothetical protein
VDRLSQAQKAYSHQLWVFCEAMVPVWKEPRSESIKNKITPTEKIPNESKNLLICIPEKR